MFRVARTRREDVRVTCGEIEEEERGGIWDWDRARARRWVDERKGGERSANRKR